jgi:uncharacterized protein
MANFSIRLWLTAISLAALLLPLPSVQAQKPTTPDAAQIDAAKAFLDAAGQAKTFETALPLIMNQFVDVMGKSAPDKIGVIREVMQQMMPKFLARKQEVLDQIAVLYASQMSIEDMKAATAFFKSQAGQRFVALQPQLMQQSMVIGQRWGQKIGQDVDNEMRQELKKRGITL